MRNYPVLCYANRHKLKFLLPQVLLFDGKEGDLLKELLDGSEAHKGGVYSVSVTTACIVHRGHCSGISVLERTTAEQLIWKGNNLKTLTALYIQFCDCYSVLVKSSSHLIISYKE